MTPRTLRLGLLNLVAWSIVLHMYVLLRFNFDWLSGDAAIFTKIIESAQAASSIQGDIVYQYGFGYQVIMMFWSSITSISVVQLQVVVMPLVGALPTFIVYPLFRRLVQDGGVGLLAAYLFGIQSDVLFTTYRSTHEKFTWLLMAIILLLFLITVGKPSQKRSFTTILGTTSALYLSMFALFSVNLFFSNTFLLILLLGFLVGFLGWKRTQISWSRRLAFVCLSGMVIFFSFVLYVYQPAIAYLRGLASYGQIILTTILSFENQSTPQYQYVLSSWPSVYLWLLLTAATWIILALSGYSFYRRIIRGKHGETSPTFLLLGYLWLGAVAVLVVGIIADRFGGYSSNLELRLVPVVILFGSPMACLEILCWVHRTRRNRPVSRAAIVVILLIVVTPLSVMKATADPSVSNIRTYVTSQEKAALSWTLTHRFEQPIWTDPGGRMISEAHLLAPYEDFANYSALLSGPVGSKYYMVSEVVSFLYPTEVRQISNATDCIIYSDGGATIFMHS